MVSLTAKSSVAELKAKGLDPTFDDIVRLNALGLRLEAAQGKNVMSSTWHLPRIARISEDLTFRQPTVGHEIWFDKVRRFCDSDDVGTAMAVKAYALTRPSSELPDGDDPAAVRKAVGEFAERFAEFTREQIYAALCYAIYGADPCDREEPARKREDADGSRIEDWDDCYCLGVLCEGEAVLWGLSGADMRELTPRQLVEVIDRARYFHGKPVFGEADRLQGEYFATVDEIEDRLRREASNG